MNKKRECGVEGFFTICLIAACPSAAPYGAAEGQVGRRLHGASRAVQTAAHLRRGKRFYAKTATVEDVWRRICRGTVMRRSFVCGAFREAAGVRDARESAAKGCALFLSAGGCAEKSKIF